MKNLSRVLKLVMSLAMTITLVACSGKKKETVKLIDFTGLSKTDVESWLNDNHVDRELVFYSYEYSETVGADHVISQSIPAGQELDEEKLTIVLSNGVDPEAEITLIDFTDMSLEEIQQWFVNEHFQNVSVQYVYERGVEPGKFLGTNIEDGKAIRTDAIAIKVSGDPEQAGVAVTIPAMNNWTKAQVEEWGNNNGITVNYSTSKSATVAQGCVLSVSPAPNTSIVKGDSIQVVISAGNSVDAINLAGKSRQDVETWGTNNNIQISWVQCWNQTASGTVYWNQPNNGTMKMGDIMKVFISVGPIPVKDYTGLSYQNNFLGWFNSINQQYNATASLKVSISEKETTDKDSGVILSQTPASGYINPGSTIALVIARHVDPQPTPTPTPSPGPETVTIPSMVGYSEFDFKHALHAYGVWEGTRTEQYSHVIAKDYIVSNDTGTYTIGSSVNYIVSLGEFTIVPQFWTGKLYSDFSAWIDSANRCGANVTVNVDYVETDDPAADGRIQHIDGPFSDNTVSVQVARMRLY